MMKKSSTVCAVTALLVLSLAACGDDGAGDNGTADDKTTLTVFAASSLTATFGELEASFEDDHPDVDVVLAFGGSSDLVTQIVEGAEADVFASADTANMDKLADADLAGSEPVEFATNTLTIAVPPGNPAGVRSLEDLAEPDLKLVLCLPEVPCGKAAAGVADAAGVELGPDSEEEKVTDVLTKVSTGEADAGLVYVTDVKAAGDAVEGIDFPEAGGVVNHYPIAVVEGSEHAEIAQQWVDLVTGATGRQVLADAGFGPPGT